MAINPSLAGTGRPYAVIQGRVEGTTLKIQGKGPNTNRSYGISITVPIPADLSKWMAGIKATYKSLAGTDARYFAMQSAVVDKDTVRVQVSGNKLNRSYGAVFSVKNSSLVQFVTAALEEAAKKAATPKVEATTPAVVNLL